MYSNVELHATTRRNNKYASWWSKLSDAEKQRRRAKRSDSMRNLRQTRRELITRQQRSIAIETAVPTTVKPQPPAGVRAIEVWLETLTGHDGNSSANGGLALGASANEEDAASSHNVASQVSQLSPLAFVKEVGWTRKLFAWFLGEYERTRRYTAYLFGKGGEGKTRTVRALLQGKNVFECRLTEPYAFDGFDADVDILLIEDVNWLCFHDSLRSTLLSIMARQPSVIQRKFKKQMVVENRKVLTIFTSNFKLPDDAAFRRRCYVVWANEKACIDDVAAGEDDAGDDDAEYANPKSLTAAKHIFEKRGRV